MWLNKRIPAGVVRLLVRHHAIGIYQAHVFKSSSCLFFHFHETEELLPVEVHITSSGIGICAALS